MNSYTYITDSKYLNNTHTHMYTQKSGKSHDILFIIKRICLTTRTNIIIKKGLAYLPDTDKQHKSYHSCLSILAFSSLKC